MRHPFHSHTHPLVLIRSGHQRPFSVNDVEEEHIPLGQDWNLERDWLGRVSLSERAAREKALPHPGPQGHCLPPQLVSPANSSADVWVTAHQVKCQVKMHTPGNHLRLSPERFGGLFSLTTCFCCCYCCSPAVLFWGCSHLNPFQTLGALFTIELGNRFPQPPLHMPKAPPTMHVLRCGIVCQ